MTELKIWIGSIPYIDTLIACINMDNVAEASVEDLSKRGHAKSNNMLLEIISHLNIKI